MTNEDKERLRNAVLSSEYIEQIDLLDLLDLIDRQPSEEEKKIVIKFINETNAVNVGEFLRIIRKALNMGEEG